MSDLLTALFHAVVYALVSGVVLIVAYYVLDLVTPGHLGSHLHGTDEDGRASVHLQSRSAGLVASSWMVSNALVLFTAIWVNGATDLGEPLAWTVSFALLGVALNAAMLCAIDAVTPGNLRQIVTEPGPVRPLAWLAAASSLSVAAIVCASIA
ncbi:DUF350 domain-containing protein [Nocardioides solisilvae]|uniref:DUF350 domain-containing protein n=1 Tax=Nocardioides solisilvae TaxID=1542435 RepID=UPI000D74AB6B|nr:DUF350 domain-containing protein [Nocardioides solisilvae]